MRIGNVIRDPEGYMWIVSKVDERVDGTGIVEAIDFDHENCSATQKLEDHVREDWCEGCADNEYGGHYHKVKVKGWKHSKVLAPSVKEFILRKFKKVMEIS